MKVIKQTQNVLILKENILMTRLLGVFFVFISFFAGIYISMNYTESVKPALILCIIFFTIGLIILFFLTARLQYHIDKTANQVKIGYPAQFATRVEYKEFKLSELKSIQFKHAIGPSSTDDGFSGPRNMKGFDFELESGELIHCGIYTTSLKEIIGIIQKILEFKNIPVVDSKKKEILWV